MTSVLLIVDMINPYDFPDAEHVQADAEKAVQGILRAREAADDAGVAVVYANDILDDFLCSRDTIVQRALEGERPDLVEPIIPRETDPVFQKGQHSAMYGTPLPHWLTVEGVKAIAVAGQVTDQCILYTVLDLYVRKYDVTVLTDCVATGDAELGAAALRMMESNMHARTATVEEWAGSRVG